MVNFTLYTPTRIFFGRDTHKQVGEIVKSYGFSRVLLLYGGQSIKRTGVYDAVCGSLRESGVTFCEMGGVQPNPTVAFCREVAEFARDQGIDLLLPVGGGSVIDTAKMAAHAAANDADVLDIQLKRVPIRKTIPVGVVLTIAAAGSETSDSAVLTDKESGRKRGLSTEYNRPLFAVMNPELTCTVSPYQTACGTTDILMHTMERYIRLDEGDHALVDGICESLCRSVIAAGRTAVKRPEDYDARATLMLAGSWSHNGMMGAGSLYNMTAHKLEHEMSGVDDRIAHGAGLAVVWPAYLSFISRYAPARVAQYARNIWGCTEEDDDMAIKRGIRRTRMFFDEIGMPDSLRSLGLQESDIELMADRATDGGSAEILAVKPLTRDDVMEIYRLCL